MKRVALLVAGILVLVATPSLPQSLEDVAAYKEVVPYESLKKSFPGLTPQLYDQVVRKVVREQQIKYLGRLSANPFDADSTANPLGQYGSPLSSDSLNNELGAYGSRFSPKSPRNPFATDTPKLYGSDGEYLGKLSGNRFDPDSVSNPFGRYGSKYSPDSIKNPYGRYGSPYSPTSPNNPYSLDSPIILDTSPSLYSLPELPSPWDD